MAQYNFGIGSLALIPPSVAAGAADATPQQVGVLKDVNLDISFTLKELMGSLGAPVDVARGPLKVTGKAKYGQIRGGLFAALLTGATLATGSKVPVFAEPTGVIAGATYTAVNGANYADDLGVLDETGAPLTKVLAAPGAGQYSVSAAGVYTFNVAANGKVYTVSYSWTSATVGKTVTYNNQTMGAILPFQLTLFTQTTRAGTTKTFGCKLFAVAIPKLSVALKPDDYVEQDIDLMAYADATNRIIEVYTAE